MPILLALMLVLGSSQLAAAQAVFKSGVDLVSFGLSVVDRKGEVITELTRDDFEIRERGHKQEISFFARGDDTEVEAPPLHIGLLLDTSGSMSEDLKLARSAAIKFLNTLTHAEDMTLVDFDTEVRVARYGQNDFPRMVERIRNRKADGWTALYDALGVYLDGAFGQDGQKILVIYTDGGDTRSAMTYSDLQDLLRASDVTLYAIGLLDNQRSMDRTEGRMRLQQMAELTGGQAYFPHSMKEVETFYDKIVAEINARYVLGYLPADLLTDGTWREVEIKVTKPELKGAKIRTRKGYFAPLKEAQGR